MPKKNHNIITHVPKPFRFKGRVVFRLGSRGCRNHMKLTFPLCTTALLIAPPWKGVVFLTLSSTSNPKSLYISFSLLFCEIGVCRGVPIGSNLGFGFPNGIHFFKIVNKVHGKQSILSSLFWCWSSFILREDSERSCCFPLLHQNHFEL